MKGIKEFKDRIESDEAFCTKFADVTDENQIFALAKAEGYDLELLSDEELDMVAAGGIFDGGGIFDWVQYTVKAAMYTFKHPVSTTANLIKAIADNDKMRMFRLAKKIDDQDICEIGDEVVTTVIDKGIDAKK